MAAGSVSAVSRRSSNATPSTRHAPARGGFNFSLSSRDLWAIPSEPALVFDASPSNAGVNAILTFR